MEDKQNLRDFQAQLAERLKGAQQQARVSSKLGFVAGGRNWLTDLNQVNEVVTAARLTPVPWAKPWFLGVVSVRGVIYGCTDLAAFLDLAAPSEREENRLLLAHPRHGVNAALAIEQAVGLRSVQTYTCTPRTEFDPAWVLAHWEDAEGGIWTEMSIEQLVVSPEFQQAGIETL
jgi:twitching motility protein PilI